MTAQEVNNCIGQWNAWLSPMENPRYDIALFKVWIKFEKFLSDLFITYATGQPSEKGYCPRLKIQFKDEEQLNAFLRSDKKYIDYYSAIQKLSAHIFEDDPFGRFIFEDANNHNVVNEIFAIRNYVAHESGESRDKLVKECFGGRPEKFIEPNEYLKSKQKKSTVSNFTRYEETLKNLTEILIDPPEI